MNDFTKLVNLASDRLGARVVEANDEFFAPKSNLLKSSKPIFLEGKFTTRGKWMDGWETRRRRTPGYDWCIIRLGLPGIVRGVVVDTAFFKGNYPERFSLEGCDLPPVASFRDELKRLQSPEMRWAEFLPETSLVGDSQNVIGVENEGRFTHVRLKIYPDGGIARLRIHGEVVPHQLLADRSSVDLAAIENGGRPIASSDHFFGEPLNLLLPGPSKNMGDGWETRRRRGIGHDWAIIQLGGPGEILRAEVDTSHFKGNFPESCSLEAAYFPDLSKDFHSEDIWKSLLSRTQLKANHRHFFEQEIQASGVVTHVRLNIYPDGGVARLRLFGRSERLEDRLKGVDRINQVTAAQAQKALFDCCGAREWVARMLVHKPFSSVEQLIETADSVWAGLSTKEWLEAFRHHPAIGRTQSQGKQSLTARRSSAAEQSVAQQASSSTLSLLSAANRKYYAKFGHVFLICATGKTSEEILQSLQERLPNDREVELRIAAEEQGKIMRLRLQRILTS